MAVTVADCDVAIAAIQDNGQSFTLGDMTYSAANLSALLKLRETLQREDQRSGGRRPLMRGFRCSGAGYSSSTSATTPTPVYS